MDHPLDRPIWSALTSRQATLSLGDTRALRFAADFGIFAAAADRSPASLTALAALVPEDGQVALVEAMTPAVAPGTAIVSTATIWQMVAPSIAAAPPPDIDIVDLTDADGPQMLALATETRPGPFFVRTHQLGDFVGVKQNGRLIAMAGERMKLPGYTEVSGVCTDPEHRGRGFAAALMRVVATRILARGETPFLHSYAHNTGAIGLYQTLGFALRNEMIMQVLSRA